jgi:hypothetical protein
MFIIKRFHDGVVNDAVVLLIINPDLFVTYISNTPQEPQSQLENQVIELYESNMISVYGHGDNNKISREDFLQLWEYAKTETSRVLSHWVLAFFF